MRIPGRKVVDGWVLQNVTPGRHSTSWAGYEHDGKVAPDGEYAFRIGPRGGTIRPAGHFRLHGYMFPVDAPHGTRGEIGEFGADRVDGRRHEGFDITAACGSPLRAARGGKVERRGYDPELYGNFILIDARHSRYDLFYAHMRAPATAGRGDKVKTGEVVGAVGLTGNAQGTPCHLHFEMHARSRPLDPEPHLRRWDAYS